MKRQALYASLWSGSDILLRQGLQFATTLVLARILAPADFGLVAMLALVLGIANILVDGGLSAALIQRQDVDRVDESTVFWWNLAAGIVATVSLAAFAPLIAGFFEEPKLTPVARAMAPAIFFTALASIHISLLTKKLVFKTLARAGAIAALASGVVAVLLAVLGLGVMALAVQAVVMSALMSALLWMTNSWRPLARFRFASLRSLFGFGGYHLGSTLMEVMYARLYTVLVGRLFGARDLGYYATADNTRQLPGNFLVALVGRVLFPMFSAAADDHKMLRRGLQFAIRITILLNAPLMLGLAVLSTPVVSLLFGERWHPVAPLLSILCLANVLFPLHAVNLHALMAQGHAKSMFKLEMLKKLLGIILIGVGAFFGMAGIAWSQVVYSVLALLLNTYYSRKLLDYGGLAQLRDTLPAIACATVMAVAVALILKSWSPAPFTAVAVLVPVGGLIYLGMVAVFRLKAFDDALSLHWRQRGGDPYGSDSHGSG